ncbi:YbhB/YbcL family Raf kinase inhibitor-like protein [Cupriavidus basilensis]
MSLALEFFRVRPWRRNPGPLHLRGEDVSPPLAWSGVPAGTVTLALIVDDPDAPDPAAPRRTWVHWVMYNLPPQAGQLTGACPAKPARGYQGRAQRLAPDRLWRTVPADRAASVLPPSSTHSTWRCPTCACLTRPRSEPAAMRGHVLAHADLIEDNFGKQGH